MALLPEAHDGAGQRMPLCRFNVIHARFFYTKSIGPM